MLRSACRLWDACGFIFRAQEQELPCWHPAWHADGTRLGGKSHHLEGPQWLEELASRNLSVQMQSLGPETDPTAVTAQPEHLLGSVGNLLGEEIVKRVMS